MNTSSDTNYPMNAKFGWDKLVSEMQHEMDAMTMENNLLRRKIFQMQRLLDEFSSAQARARRTKISALVGRHIQ